MGEWLASGSETESEAATLGPYGPHGPESGRCVTAGFTSLSQRVSLYLGCNMGWFPTLGWEGQRSLVGYSS